MEERFQKIELDVEAVKSRNSRVEAEKAWETSFFRVATIAFITYVIALFIMKSIGVKDFFLNAFVPTVGYILSTQSLPFIKKWWIEKFFKKQKRKI